jgi:hypothetical protein
MSLPVPPAPRRLSDWGLMILSNVSAGLVLGFAMAAALIVLDVHGLGSLLRRSDTGFVAVVLLCGGFASFAAAGLLSTSIHLLPDPAGRAGGPDGFARRLRPAPVRARRMR